ncbi:MAG: hypothetical protein A3F13_01530 [Gammaproteobacteria bacterium RIFCSPHIGHO2_12_FULL_40_19]|nr:MAG: hypothetical protein A3F13_01530 [Gammaproteobacteria bacterium RIFCSPHIGHO2_12_FULL_40_19]
MSYLTGTGIQLAKQSLAILKQKKSLILFPILSTVIVLAVFITGLTPLFKIEAIAWTNPSAVNKTTVVIFYFIFLALFFIAHLFTTLFNVGLTDCIIKHLKNEPYTIGAAFKRMFFRFPRIYLWVSLMTSFGVFVRIVEYWSDHWPSSKTATDTLAGLPWLVATFLVTPILTIENINPWRAIKRSAQLVKNTWGAPITSNIAIGKITVPLKIIAFLPVLIMLLIGGKTKLLIGSIITSLLFFSIGTVASAIHCTLTSALYLYANTVNISPNYDAELLKNAFCPVKKRRVASL